MESPVALDSECFFIAPIGAEGSPERKRPDGVLEFIVARAAGELGLTAVRADQIAEPGQITLQVIEHVLGAKAAVVDLTGLNANVFYELAVRHTARLPVVLIAEKGCLLPFDIAQMRTIFFDHTDLASADQCRKDIVRQIGEGLAGSVDSPIATSVDIRTMQSGSPVERSLAEVLTSIEDLGRTQRQMMFRLQDVTTSDIHPGAIEDLVEQVSKLKHLMTDDELLRPDVAGASLLYEAVGRLDEVSRYLEDRTGSNRRRPGRPRRTSPSERESARVDARERERERRAKLVGDPEATQGE